MDLKRLTFEHVMETDLFNKLMTLKKFLASLNGSARSNLVKSGIGVPPPKPAQVVYYDKNMKNHELMNYELDKVVGNLTIWEIHEHPDGKTLLKGEIVACGPKADKILKTTPDDWKLSAFMLVNKTADNSHVVDFMFWHLITK